MIRRALTTAACLVVLAAPRLARAHDFNPGVLSLTETSPGAYDMAWTEPVDSTGSQAGVHVAFPTGCRVDGARVDCRPGDLAGVVSFTGMHARRMKVVVVIRHLSGHSDERLVTGADPRVDLGSAAAHPSRSWLLLGVDHILTGYDHLAFLLGLLLVLGIAVDRRLLFTISAFTVAHSLTLALAATGVLRLPSAPVEAMIAASVVLVARESLDHRPTAIRRWPWLVAGLFGLVHGLGFAGALTRLGLPDDAIAPSLLWFNLGVELGQLIVVAAAVLVARAALLVLHRDGGARQARRGIAYLLGSLGGCWFLLRALAIAGS